ncbi:MAG: carbohydrate ABC transporter permease [Sporolactobacillus sp.]
MRQVLTKSTSYFILTAVSVMMIFPLLWMALSAFKSGNEMFATPLVWLPKVWHWEHFAEGFRLAPFATYLCNSFFTAAVIVFVQIGLSCLIAYGLTQIKFCGQGLLFQSLLVTYMLPAAVTYVPSYVILARIGLLDSLTGIIISNIGSVFSIFLLRQAFLKVPGEVIEAARCEGAGDLAILWRVMLPMARSTILTLSMITFVEMYNNYMWPSLIVKSPNKYLITVGLNQFFTQQGTFTNQWPLIMAVSTVAVLPLLLIFFVLQKWFIKGISDSGLKG